MGSINKSHNEADGGILLFNGELILLYCDSVHCEIAGKESVKVRVYLTTHRLVMIVTPYRQNSAIKSLCAPFCAITKCSVEQPIFGANYIEATVRDEVDSSKSFSFKLKFSKGGAIELAMAMNRAVAAVGRNYNPSMPPPPAYTPSPSAQYYQAPPTVYAPGYNCGIQMPIQQFPDQPPIGFIYASSAPPPYPGLGGAGAGGANPAPSSGYGGAGNQAGQPGYPTQTAPAYPTAGGYPTAQPPGYPTQQPTFGYGNPSANYPQLQPYAPTAGFGQHPTPNSSIGYPQAQQQQTQQPTPGYPQQPAGYPQQAPVGYPSAQPLTPASSGYPAQQPPQGGYPGAASYPQAQVVSAPPGAQSSASGYPDLSQTTSSESTNQAASNAWPSAPAFNPNWQDDSKKSN